MGKYQLLELIAGLFQNRKEIKSTSIDYKRTENKSGSMIVITKDEEVFEVRVRRL